MENSEENITNLYKKIKKTKKFTHEKINNYLKEVFELKIKNIENLKNYKILNHMQDILEYENDKLNTFKMTIISAIGTIFLPLGFITGYFGMNFRSMGSPSLKTGILTMKNVERFILSLSIFSIIIVSSIYYIYF